MKAHELIKQELKKQKIYQKELASYLRIGDTYLSNLLNGNYAFTKTMLIDVAAFLGIPKENLGIYDINTLLDENESLKSQVNTLKKKILMLLDVIGEQANEK